MSYSFAAPAALPRPCCDSCRFPELNPPSLPSMNHAVSTPSSSSASSCVQLLVLADGSPPASNQSQQSKGSSASASSTLRTESPYWAAMEALLASWRPRTWRREEKGGGGGGKERRKGGV